MMRTTMATRPRATAPRRSVRAYAEKKPVFTDAEYADALANYEAEKKEGKDAAKGEKKAGRVFSDEEYEEALKKATDPAAAAAAATELQTVSFGDAMAFAGAAPEKTNGRLAMVAFVAAAGAEFSTHETISQQFGDATVPIVATAVTFIVASLVPILKGAVDEPVGPFNSKAEMYNGRAAMLGLSLLLILENNSGKAFF